MASKVVSQSSEKTVIRKRLKFTETDLYSTIGTGIFGSLGSVFVVAMPLNLNGVHLGLSLLGAAVTGLGAAGLAFLGKYGVEAVDEFEKHITTEDEVRYSWMVLKAIGSSVLPLGQSIKSQTKAAPGRYGFSESQTDLVTYPVTYHPGSSNVVESKLKFTPRGAYIEQTITPTPGKIWDDAFASTVAVHEFDAKRAISMDKKTNTELDNASI